ncbi:MAG: hypothetical protein MUE73_08480 [Planctomycetes bacterium]|jgi:hypothetical protein|nr:hypothetical protein [Planctomycetota bacterium]
MVVIADEFEREWEWAWREFAEVLSDLGRKSGQWWPPDTLAVFLDVPSLSIAHLLPQARAAGLTEGLDLVERVRTGVRGAMARLKKARVGGTGRPLPLTFGLTEALLVWDWLEMEAAGQPSWNFFERLRNLRLRIPEVSLCERTVYQFCRRVPPPGFG